MTQSTHDLQLGEHEVVKVFRIWERGEPDREWKALCLLDEAAPGLAPEPVARRTVDGRPAVVMKRLPGEPLGATPLTDRQTAAVAAAMTRLHTARLVDFEDSGASDRAFEVADLLEHVSVGLAGVLDADRFLETMDVDARLRVRLRRTRRLFATLWLHMLLPGNPGHGRNPPGSVEKQAARTLDLLA